MRNRGVLFVLTAVITIGTLLAGTNVDFASANSSLEQRIQDIQQERSQAQQQVNTRENEISSIQRERKDIEEDVKRLDHEMADTRNEIKSRQTEIQDTRKHIEELQAELVIIEARINERDQLLKERARSMYQNGGSVSYLEVILGAKSFGDFLDRVSALSMIAQQDQNILQAHLDDQKLVEETKTLVEEELAKLEVQLATLEGLMAQLDKQKKEKDNVLQELLIQEQDLHAELGELEDVANVLAQQERAMKAELEAWKERERQRQISGEPAPSGNGKLLRPAAGRISSQFGNRVHPVYGTTKLHRGLDIANSTGTPIVAAEGGTVITARYMSGYGNTVMISHNVNGQVMTTLYAHLSSIQVSNGQRVGRGDQIGLMGATGTVTGTHLHFEVHLGPWSGDANAVNPLNYFQ